MMGQIREREGEPGGLSRVSVSLISFLSVADDQPSTKPFEVLCKTQSISFVGRLLREFNTPPFITLYYPKYSQKTQDHDLDIFVGSIHEHFDGIFKLQNGITSVIIL